MRLTSLILILSCFRLLGAEVEKGTADGKRTGRDLVLFRNGDLLYGSLNSINQTNGIEWSRSDAISGFQLTPRQVSEIVLSRTQSAPEITSSNYCTIQLNNGDQLQGVLNGYDGEKVTLDTWYGGRMVFPKSSVAMLVPVGFPRKVLFEGPNGLEGWTMGEVNAAVALLDSGQWLYQKHAFYALKSASIARDVHLPDQASLSFDIEWRGFFHLAIALYTEYLNPINLANKETEPKFGGFYSLQINPFSANLLPVKQSEPLRYLGQAPLQNLSQKTSAHIDIRVSKQKKLLALLIDGVVVKQWLDSDAEFAGSGSAIRFVHQGQGAVKLTNIKVTEWDGHFEEPPSLTPNKPHDIARLKNGDRVPGAVKSIQDAKMKVEGGGTVLDIPMARVKQIEFAGKPLTETENTNKVRAFLVSGGSLTFELQQWTPEGLMARSDNFGTVTFKPGSFARLLFDLNKDESVP